MLKSLCVFLLAGLLLAVGAEAQGATVSPPVQSKMSRAELLVHAPDGVQPGATLWLGLQITHAPDWHTYWKNSGDSGLPTRFEWQLPAGVTPLETQWPTPRKFRLGSLANYGYNGTVLLPIPLRVDADFEGQELNAEVLARWLICHKQCIPEEASFRVRIPAQLASASHTGAFESAWAAVPVDQPGGNSSLTAQANGLQVQLEGLPAPWHGAELEFFPEVPGLIEPGAAWQQQWVGGTWQALIPYSRFRSESPAALALVVTPANPPGSGPGLSGVRMDVALPGGWPEPAAAPAYADGPENTAPATTYGSNDQALTLGLALLGALIGGMLLNLMPCVFPVLAIKVLAFAQHGDNRSAQRMGGLAYTAGVVLSFAALGLLLLALRAAGEQFGWGFQLQDPLVVAALAALFTVIGLNLAGLFDFGRILPSSVTSLQAKNPTADSFLTGVLATAVASPCTAPFMGASLGLAVTLPPTQALAVFAVLGLGMALPYLVASWVPGFARALPRPGPWMETLRQLLAFPMFATVVWLLWVLGQQSGIDGAAALLMLLLALSLLIWAINKGGKVRTVLGVLSALVLAWLLWALGPHVTRQQLGSAYAAQTSVQGLAWEAWSPQREAELLAQGRPVFVDYTAAWCVSCQYNKLNALADQGFLQDAAQRNVALLRADWTRRDPQVTQALAQLGRNGVPVYVLHAPGREPLLLPEILTAEIVRSAIQQL